MKSIISLKQLFEAEDIFGKKIRTSVDYWRKIKEEKHADLIYEPVDVVLVLRKPDFVYQSVKDSTIAIYAKKMEDNKTLVVLAKHLNGEGFIVTVYQTTKFRQKGKILWQK